MGGPLPKFLNCSYRLHKTKNIKNFKQRLLHNYLADFNKTWIVPWEVLYQNCSNCSAPLHKMEARAKNSNDISITTWWISTKLDRIVPREVPYKNCTNHSTSVHKMVARATDIKKTSNSTTKIAQIVWLHCTKWQPELKIEKKKFKQHLLRYHLAFFNQIDRIVPWEILYQYCSNCSTLLHKVAARA